MPAPDLDADDATLLAQVQAGAAPSSALLRLGRLEAGQVGVVEAEVRGVGVVRAYNRKRGGQGLLVRATLADATGEADLVLWDDEVRLAQDGPLQLGRRVRLHGPSVKAGRDGRPELGLGSAHVVELPAGPALGEGGLRRLQGLLLDIGTTLPVGAPPLLRFKAELVVQTKAGPVRVVAWDDAVKQAREAGVGSHVTVEGAPNPLLDGWWTATRLLRNP